MLRETPLYLRLNPADDVVYDPDEQVQHVVRLIFRKFDELGTLHALLRYLRHPAPPPQFTCGTHCGEERWRIKTVFDNDAAHINFTPRPTTIAELVSQRAPSVLEEEERSSAEKQVYSVEAVLLGWKLEGGAKPKPDNPPPLT